MRVSEGQRRSVRITRLHDSVIGSGPAVRSERGHYWLPAIWMSTTVAWIGLLST